MRVCKRGRHEGPRPHVRPRTARQSAPPLPGQRQSEWALAFVAELERARIEQEAHSVTFLPWHPRPKTWC